MLPYTVSYRGPFAVSAIFPSLASIMYSATFALWSELHIQTGQFTQYHADVSYYAIQYCS